MFSDPKNKSKIFSLKSHNRDEVNVQDHSDHAIYSNSNQILPSLTIWIRYRFLLIPASLGILTLFGIQTVMCVLWYPKRLENLNWCQKCCCCYGTTCNFFFKLNKLFLKNCTHCSFKINKFNLINFNQSTNKNNIKIKSTDNVNKFQFKRSSEHLENYYFNSMENNVYNNNYSNVTDLCCTSTNNQNICLNNSNLNPLILTNNFKQINKDTSTVQFESLTEIPFKTNHLSNITVNPSNFLLKPNDHKIMYTWPNYVSTDQLLNCNIQLNAFNSLNLTEIPYFVPVNLNLFNHFIQAPTKLTNCENVIDISV